MVNHGARRDRLQATVVGLSQDLAGALPGILAELRSWGLLDHGKPDDGPGLGAGAA